MRTVPDTRSAVLKGRYLEHMTWREAELALQETRVVVIPLGARCKEHGLHLPLNNDWRIAEYLTRRVLEQCNVLAVPTVQYGYYPAFLEYPGSISLSQDTCCQMIEEICESLFNQVPSRALGFYVLNTGISTNRSLAPARERLESRGIRMRYTDLHQIAPKLRESLVTQLAGTHADEIETSMMLYIAPETVRMDQARKDIHPDHGPGPLTRNPDASRGVYSPTGAWGDPTLATVEKGRIWVEAVVRHIVEEIETLSSPGV